MPASGSGKQRYGCAASFESARAAFEAMPLSKKRIDADEILEGAEAQEESKVAVNKITWAQVGRVTEPGRYMFKFGWLTITADDLVIWEKYPTAAFTLYSASVTTPTKTEDKTDDEGEDEFRLGTFELRSDSNYSESEK
jgi:hypothetical protein